MEERPRNFTIVGHSIGCLIAMKIMEQFDSLQNIVCLAPPLIESPTKFINRDIEIIMREIQEI